MNHQKNKANKSNWPLVLCLLAVVAVVAVIPFLARRDAETPAPERNGTTMFTPQDTEPPTEPPVTGVPVETPYCVLYYLTDWQDCMRTEQKEEDNLVVTFYGRHGDTELALFEVIFGNADAPGHLFGTIPGGDGTDVQIRVNVIEFLEDSSWSQEKLAAMYAMQEEVNNIIGQIYQLSGFVRAD